MVLNSSQALDACIQHVPMGLPAALVRGQLSRVVDSMYRQGYGLALKPVESGYSELTAQEAVFQILLSANQSGVNIAAYAQRISQGVQALASKDYVFVRRVK